ncbi:MAG: Flp pilus assembly protein CpaB [Micrococcales bacterium]|nr:Flp pilus assembly protein CpaB [Micrococcales bacterium]
MNPRQKRGAVLLVLTAIGAIAVFISTLVYVGDVNAQVGNKVDVLRLTKNVPAYQAIDPSMYEVVQVPERWTTDAALRSPADVAGLVTAAALPQGAVLQKGMVIPRPSVAPGYQEIAIMVNAETGVAGKVRPGDKVDIVATFAGTDEENPPMSVVWVSNVRVMEVGVVTSTSANDTAGSFGESRGVPITFALTTRDVLRLTYAESFSVELRLSLRGAGDDTQVPFEERVFQPGVPTLERD